MDQRGSSPQDKPLYMFSVAAELTGMHPQTLRVYEQKGLVNPGRSRGNTRLYSARDIERLNLISKLTDEGINLAGVVRILDMRERKQTFSLRYQKKMQVPPHLYHQIHLAKQSLLACSVHLRELHLQKKR